MIFCKGNFEITPNLFYTKFTYTKLVHTKNTTNLLTPNLSYIQLVYTKWSGHVHDKWGISGTSKSAYLSFIRQSERDIACKGPLCIVSLLRRKMYGSSFRFSREKSVHSKCFFFIPPQSFFKKIVMYDNFSWVPYFHKFLTLSYALFSHK